MVSVDEMLLRLPRLFGSSPAHLKKLRLYIDDCEDLEDKYYGDSARKLLRRLGARKIETLSLVLDLHDCDLGMDVDKKFGRDPGWPKWLLAFGKNVLPHMTTVRFDFAVDISEPVHERSLWVKEHW